MRKLTLASYTFQTGNREFEETQLLALETSGKLTEEQKRDILSEKFKEWFKETYPESKLLSFIPKPTVQLLHIPIKHEEYKPLAFMHDQLNHYPDNHMFSVEDIKRLINLAATGNAEGRWTASEVNEEVEEEASIIRNTEIVGGFMEHCKEEGLEIPDKYFESFFNA